MGKLQRSASRRKAELDKLAAEQRADDDTSQVKRHPREVGFRETDQASGAPARAPRVNRTDAPEDYDPELGLILEGRQLEAEPCSEDAARFAELATQVIGYLGHASRWRGLMPLATPPPWPPDAKINSLVWRALPELEALHRALIPGWRAIVLEWLREHALARVERSQRETRRNDGPRVNLMPERSPRTGASLLESLRRNPPELMGPVPEGLAAEMLDGVAERVSRGGRGSGTWTPEGAMRRLDRWLASPDPRAAAKADLAGEKTRKQRRRRAQE